MPDCLCPLLALKAWGPTKSLNDFPTLHVCHFLYLLFLSLATVEVETATTTDVGRCNYGEDRVERKKRKKKEEK